MSLDYDLSIIQDDAADAARTALEKIRNRRNEINESKKNAEFISKQNREREFILEFDESQMDTKIKCDALFYEYITTKMGSTDDISDEVTEAITEMIKAQVEFYKVLNIAPILNHINERELVNNSDDENATIVENVVTNYMRNNLYKLTTEQRKEKYESKVVPMAESLVRDFSANHDNAVDLAYKTVVVEGLLKHIHNSIYVNLYYNDCLESEQYTEFFNVDKLKRSYEVYEEAVHNLAVLLAVSF